MIKNEAHHYTLSWSDNLIQIKFFFSSIFLLVDIYYHVVEHNNNNIDTNKNKYKVYPTYYQTFRLNIFCGILK